MTLTEFLVYFAIVCLCFAFVFYNFSGIVSCYKIRTAKARLNGFLEELRTIAIIKRKNTRVYFNSVTNRLWDSEGRELESHFISSSNRGFVIRYCPDGSIVIEKGITTLTYDDLSALTIVPITGRVVY